MTITRYAFLLACGMALSMLAACDSPEDKQTKYTDRGDRYFAEEDYVRARLEYRNAAKINPTDPGIIYSLGLVEEAQGNLQAALSAFLTTEQQDSNFEPVIQKLAEFFLTVHQDEEAKVRIYRLLSINPDNAMAHALNASVDLKRGDLAAAQASVGKAMALDSKNIIAYSVQSGIYNAGGEPEKAIAILDRGIAIHPDDVSLYLLKAMIYAGQDNLEAVAEVYRKIFELNPETIRYRFDLAQILSTSKDPAAAEKILRDTVEKFPDSEEAKRKLIELVERKDGLPAAETQIKAYLEKSPERKTLYLWLAELYVRNKREDLAITALRNILEAPGEEWVGLTANTSMARIKLGQGDIDLATRLIESVLSKDANNNEALFLRANLAYARGDYEQALGDLRNVVRDNPSSPHATRLMTEILLLQGHRNLAIDTLIQYHSHANDDLGAQVRLSQLYALNGDNKHAFEILKNLTRNEPDYALAWETLVRLSIENKSFGQAEEAIAKLDQAGGQDVVALFLRGQLDAARGEQQAAREIYQSLIGRYPDSPLVAYALSGLLAGATTKDDLSGLESFLAGQETSNVSVLAVLGGVQSALGKNAEAVQSLRRCIELKPQDVAPYLSLSQLLKEEGDLQGAREALDLAEKDLPFESRASLMKADILISQGEIDRGFRIYESLLERNKGTILSDVIANNYAQAVADHKGQDKEALDRARIIAERFMNSSNPYYLDTLAWVYFKQGNIASAEPLLKKAKALLKDPNEQIESHYRELLKALGQNEKTPE